MTLTVKRVCSCNSSVNHCWFVAFFERKERPPHFEELVTLKFWKRAAKPQVTLVVDVMLCWLQ